jgi:hypothetical protein
MRGLDPRISGQLEKDARLKAGHDDMEAAEWGAESA